MKWEFRTALHDLMKRDERVFLLWADVGGGLFKDHARDFPCRVLNAGICEQATVSMAAGMATEGFRPIIYTITPFLIERAFEQIKLDIDQMNQPVGLVGHSDGSCGPTHNELDALKLMGMFKNIQSFFPFSKGDTKELMNEIDYDKPWFMKITTL